MMLQLNPQVPMRTPKGNAQAFAMIDYSEEHNILFVCFQDESGECWTWQANDVRAFPNSTMGRASTTNPPTGS